MQEIAPEGMPQAPCAWEGMGKQFTAALGALCQVPGKNPLFACF